MPVTLKTALHVRIKDDPVLSEAFHKFQLRERVFPIRNTPWTSGPGYFNAVFAFKDRAKIEAFFKEGRFNA
jgi:hypothetical protein